MKRAIARNLGTAALRGYRLAYNLISVVTLLPVLVIPVLMPGDLIYQFSGSMLFIGLAGQATAIIILIIGLFQTDLPHFLGIRQIWSQANNSENGLVVRGLYRWVRHPLYSAGLLFIWLTPIMTSSVLALNLGLTVYIYIGSVFEELRLAHEFGAAYKRYQIDVPRLFPRIVPIKRNR